MTTSSARQMALLLDSATAAVRNGVPVQKVPIKAERTLSRWSSRASALVGAQPDRIGAADQSL
jgi:hypothetical protein